MLWDPGWTWKVEGGVTRESWEKEEKDDPTQKREDPGGRAVLRLPRHELFGSSSASWVDGLVPDDPIGRSSI